MANQDSQHDSDLSDVPDELDVGESSDREDSPPADAQPSRQAATGAAPTQAASSSVTAQQATATTSSALIQTQPGRGILHPSGVTTNAPPAPIPPNSTPSLVSTGTITLEHEMRAYHGTQTISFEVATLRDFIKNSSCLKDDVKNSRLGHSSVRGQSATEFDTAGRLKLGSIMMPFYFDLRLLSERQWNAICEEFTKGIVRKKASLGNGKQGSSLCGVMGTKVPIIVPPPVGYDYHADLVPMLFPNGNQQHPVPATAPLLLVSAPPLQQVPPATASTTTLTDSTLANQTGPQPFERTRRTSIDGRDEAERLGRGDATSEARRVLSQQRPTVAATDQSDVDPDNSANEIMRQGRPRRNRPRGSSMAGQDVVDASRAAQEAHATPEPASSITNQHREALGRPSKPAPVRRTGFLPIDDMTTVRKTPENPALRRWAMEGRHFDSVAGQWHFADGSHAPKPGPYEFLRMPDPPPARPDPRPWSDPDRYNEFLRSNERYRGVGALNPPLLPVNTTNDVPSTPTVDAAEASTAAIPDAPTAEVPDALPDASKDGGQEHPDDGEDEG